MEQKEKVVFRKKAKQAIRAIAIHIADTGHPEIAENFAKELVQFGYSLSSFPLKYPQCRQPAFAKREMHCAVYRKNYLFVYKPQGTRVIIYNIIHTSTKPMFQQV